MSAAPVDALIAVLYMSGWGTAAAAVVILLSLLLRRLPCSRTALLLLWAVVGFRLLCPAAPASALSLFNLPGADGLTLAAEGLERGYAGGAEAYPYGTEEYDRAVAAGARPELDALSRTVVYWQAEENAPARTAREVYGPVLAAVWLAGVGAMLAYGAGSCLLLRRRLRFAVRDETEPGVWLSDRVAGPCVVGLFRPRIYLPFGLTGEQRSHILAHEREHLRTGDPLWKALAWAALSVHWFNPLLWAAYLVFSRQLEDACDQRTLRRLGGEARAAYSQTLLDLASGRAPRPGLSPLSFGEGDTGRRVRAALSFRKPARWATAAVLLAAAVAGLFLATGRWDGGDRLGVVEIDGTSCVDIAPRPLPVRLLGAQAEVLEADILADFENTPPWSSRFPGMPIYDGLSFSELQGMLGRVPLRESAALAGALYDDPRIDPWDGPGDLVPATYTLETSGRTDGTIEGGNAAFRCSKDGFTVVMQISMQFVREVERVQFQAAAPLDGQGSFYDMANGGRAYLYAREGQETGTVLMAWARLDGVVYRIQLNTTEETEGPGAQAAAYALMTEILDGFA